MISRFLERKKDSTDDVEFTSIGNSSGEMNKVTKVKFARRYATN